MILSKLTHENIVRVFETNNFVKGDKVFYYLAMEFVSGESLSDLLKRKISLSLNKAIKIQTDFLKGLAIAHLNSIIHRDINPDNILLSYDEIEPKGLLSDFGLAQRVNGLEKISNAAGRYLYFAPECFSDIYMPTSDVFSAGIVFYRMLTGTSPWEIELMSFDDFDEIRKNIISSRRKKPIAPSFFNDKISKEIDRVVQKSLELNIENRYKSGAEFLTAINKII